MEFNFYCVLFYVGFVRQNTVEIPRNIAGLLQKLDVNYGKYSYHFEHDLSYILCKYIYKAIKEGYKRVVVQGPIFPEFYKKLSRMFLKNEISIYGITFDNRLSAFSIDNVFLDNTKEFKTEIERRLNFSEILESDEENKDGVIKRYAIFRERDVRYIVEVFCQFPEKDVLKGEYSDFWDGRIEELSKIFAIPGVVYLGNLDAIWLPFAIAVAYETVRKEGVSLKEIALHREYNNKKSLIAELVNIVEFDKKMKDEGMHDDPLQPEEIIMLTTLIEREEKIDKISEVLSSIPEIQKEVNKIAKHEIEVSPEVHLQATRKMLISGGVREKRGIFKKLLQEMLQAS